MALYIKKIPLAQVSESTISDLHDHEAIQITESGGVDAKVIITQTHYFNLIQKAKLYDELHPLYNELKDELQDLTSS